MFSFCLDHGLFGFIFLSVSSACSVFVSSCLCKLKIAYLISLVGYL